MTLTVGAVLLVAACGLLGRWQYARSYRPADGYTQEPAPVPIAALDSAQHPLTPVVINRQVTLSGTFDASQQRLIAGRTLGGAAVLWVVTPLRMSGGGAVEVLRGWLSHADSVLATPPTAPVQVIGRIRALEPAPASAGPLAPGEAAAIDPALLRQLPYPALAAYVVRTAQLPPDPLSLQPVPSQPPPSPPGAKKLYVLNAFYAIQWWIFALLVLYTWQRLFSAERASQAAPDPAPEDESMPVRTA